MIAVVIPSYKVKKHILNVIKAIGEEAQKIYVVDDCCPEGSGEYVEKECTDPRVVVVFSEKNQGVGGAVMLGYQKAYSDGCEIAVKIDGDEQMDPSLLPQFIAPLVRGKADYTKGNRFFFIEGLSQMPTVRLIGNAGLSFINKIVSGYWNIMDPTNGYTALKLDLLPALPLNKIAKRYFFESDMLFRLNVAKAVIQDIPMHSKYAEEESNLSVTKVLFTFPPMYLTRFAKRIFYNYFLRDFNLGSIALIFSSLSIILGSLFGLYHWFNAYTTGVSTPTGTIMLAVLPIIIGFQSLLFFLQQDISSVPTKVISDHLRLE